MGSRNREGVRRRLAARSRALLWVSALVLGVMSVAVLSLEGEDPPAVRFVDVTESANVAVEHGYPGGPTTDPRRIAAGIAAGDYDGDRWVDLYLVTGTMGPNLLLRNRGDGTFEETEAGAVLQLGGALSAGPLFGDIDGDGFQDLFVGGVESEPLRVFRNTAGTGFEDFTAESGITGIGNTFSAALGDYDRDGDLDLALAHWSRGSAEREPIHLWQNDGEGHFSAVTDAEAGLTGYQSDDFTFTPNFADIDSDGWPDLLYASDFETSRIFRNRGDGTFEDTTTDVISDKNGMGAAVGDYDNDGDLDWFVSSIGNRLYRNLGDGSFEDVTDSAGVLDGGWGWGTCFADFNNDTHLDLFQTNGFNPEVIKDEEDGSGGFFDDASRLFINRGDGVFDDRAEQWGLVDRGQGRGVSCFDYDRDGDIDIFVSNNSEGARLYRNDGGNDGGFLNVRLRRPSPEVPAVGARISVTAGGVTQLREWRVGNNFESQQPQEAHFGLGSATVVDELRVQWPDGTTQIFANLPANQFVILGGEGIGQVQQLGEELDFAHVPLGGGIQGSITLINPNPEQAIGGRLLFLGRDGLQREVELEGWGTSSSFDFSQDPIPPGGSRVLVAPAQQPLSLGWARFQTELPAAAVYRFRFDTAHIGLSPSRSFRSATVPLQTDGQLRTGVAIQNPGQQALYLEVVVVDSEGKVEASVDAPALSPLGPGSQTSFFLSEIGIEEQAGRSGGTVQIRAVSEGRFRILALADGQGTLSSTPVVGSAAGFFTPERFHGRFSGSWESPAGDPQGGVELLIGMVESARSVTASLSFSGSTLGSLPESRVDLSGEFDSSRIRLAGFSPLLGPVEMTIDADGTLSVHMSEVAVAGVDSITIAGTALSDTMEANFQVEGSAGGHTGSLRLTHLNW